LIVAGVGVVIETTCLRPVYNRRVLAQLLVTFGFVLIIGGAVRMIWGPTGRATKTPPFLQGAVGILGREFPVYQFFLMGFAIAVGVALWALLYRTRLGRMIRAAVSDPALLSLSGVNVPLVFTGVFAIGVFLTGLAGAVVAPIGSVGLGMDVSVIIR